jgi:hypothetical protein
MRRIPLPVILLVVAGFYLGMVATYWIIDRFIVNPPTLAR